MTRLTARAVLLDIEGTVSPVSFVYDVMFPYVRNHLDAFLSNNWDTDDVIYAVDLIASDLKQGSLDQWCGGDPGGVQRALVSQAVTELMDKDAKVTGLKHLQGMIWKDGFESGELVAELFEDVPDVLRQWHQQQIRLYVYSSGSIAAQQLFFGHTGSGNLLPLFSGHFDTTIGNKKHSDSYRDIATEIQVEPDQIVFVSDSEEELDAAARIELQTLWRTDRASERNGSHQTISSFREIELLARP